jgi:hypothetical protein
MKTKRFAAAAAGVLSSATMLAGCVDTPRSTEDIGQTASAITGGPHLMWWAPTLGPLSTWQLNGTTVGSTSAILSLQCGTNPSDSDFCGMNWTVVDVKLNTVLWWNKTTGTLRTWEFDSSGNVTWSDLNKTCGTADGCITSSNEWRPIGRVVFTAPTTGVPMHQTGLLWHDPVSGTVWVWEIGPNSAGTIQPSVIGSTVPTTYDLTSNKCGDGCATTWTPSATADFDGDGNSDLAWLNTQDGTVRVWLLNPAPSASLKDWYDLTQQCGGACASDWRLVGAADFDGDGRADLLWHNYRGTYPNTPPGTLRNWILNGKDLSYSSDLSKAGCNEPQPDDSCVTGMRALGYVTYPSQ